MNAKAENLIKFGSFLLALFGIPGFFLNEYFERVREDKKYTLELIDASGDAKMVADRFKLYQSMERGGVYRMLDAGASHTNVTDHLIYLFRKDHDFARSILSVSEYYDSVNSCTRSGVCDKRLIADALGCEVTQFWKWYSMLFADIRERSGFSGVGSGAEEIYVSIGARLGECR